MSRLLLGLLAIFICLYCVSCTNRTNVSTLQSGDLIFVSVPLGFDFGISSDSIGRLTSDMSDESQLQCIHVAIVDVAADTVFVIDATAKRGVARYPLDTFLYDFTLYGGHSPRYDVMRMGTPEDGARYVSNAKTYIGRPYDFDFQLDNEAQYCSELVRNAYTLDDGTPRFPLTRVDFSEGRGVLSDYWTHLFQYFGCQTPQGEGILPYDLKTCNLLTKVITDVETTDSLFNTVSRGR